CQARPCRYIVTRGLRRDPRFGTGGAITIEPTRPQDLDIQAGPLLIDSSGGLIVGASSRTSTDETDVLATLTRFDAVTGAPDPSFGLRGSIALDGAANDLVFDAQGRIVILSSVEVPGGSETLDLSRRIVDRPAPD